MSGANSQASITANVANTSATYDNPTTTVLRDYPATIGSSLVVAISPNAAATTGNTLTNIIFRAAQNCYVYATDFTVAVLGTGGATANVTVFLVPANNGVNIDSQFTSSNIALGNVAVIGTNVAGNVASTGQYTYNVYANGAASSSNTAAPGGFFVPAGSIMVANNTLNVGVLACSTQYRYAPNAVFVA